MATLTDPAEELVDACERLIRANSNHSGEHALANAFGVEAWSKEYFQIIFCLVEQAERVLDALKAERPSEAMIERAQIHTNGVRQALSGPILSTPWNNAGSTRQLLREHTPPIAMLSPTVARVSSYPKLSSEEIADLVADIDQLISWLTDHQLEEQDILRRALIDGLVVYRLRLARVGWLGWNYSADALRSTIGAYLALDRGQHTADTTPITEAALKLVGGLFSKLWGVAGVVHDATDRVGTAIKLYGMVTMVRDGTPIVAALTHQLGSS